MPRLIILHPCAATNTRKASAELVFVSDKTPPTAALSTARDGFLRFTPALINVSFSEQVESFGAGDVSVVGDATVVAVQTLEAGSAFQLSLRFDSEGDVSLFLAADAVDDLAGNGLERSASVNFTYDVTNPTASLSVDAITTESPVPFALSFSEDVTGVTASALNVTGGTISSIQPSSGFADSFVVYVTPEATVATVEVALEAGGRDGAVMDRARRLEGVGDLRRGAPAGVFAAERRGRRHQPRADRAQHYLFGGGGRPLARRL